MSANDVLTLSRGTNVIDLYSWLHGSLHFGHEALKGITGFGMPPQTNRWFEGAGDGAQYRGSRVLPRVMMIPISTQGRSRHELNQLMSQLATVLNPSGSTQAKLRYMGPDGLAWFVNVVREEGGDYVRDSNFNKNRYLRTTLGLKAGDPYWTQEDAEGFTIRQDASGRSLMPYLARLEVSSGQVFGILNPENLGDASAWPKWTIGGPATGFTLTGTNGEILEWSGVMTSSDRRIIDTKLGTIVDQDGVNRFNELGDAPQFWPIPPGNNAIQIETDGAGDATFITAEWQPRKWSIV